MGACIYVETYVGRAKTAKEAFQELVKDALYQHGHDIYNGTISTTRLTKLIRAYELPRPGTKNWYARIEELLDTQPKWECTALEITNGIYYQDLKIQHGYKGKKGIKIYQFIVGAAS